MRSRMVFAAAVTVMFAACGGKETKLPVPDTTAAMVQADTTPPAPVSPVDGAKTLLDGAIPPDGVPKLQAAADEVSSWAATSKDDKARGEALAVAATLRVVAIAARLDGDKAELAAQAKKASEEAAKATGPDAKALATATATLRAVVDGSDEVPADAWALMTSPGDLGTAARIAVLTRLDGVLSTHRADVAAGRAETLTATAARLLCPKSVCPPASLSGDAEEVVSWGDNAAVGGVLARIGALAQAKSGSKPLAQAATKAANAVTAGLAKPFALPSAAIATEAIVAPAEGEVRTALAALAGVPDSGLLVPRAGEVFVLGPDGVRGGLRPAVALDGAKLKSTTHGQGPSLDDAATLTLAALAEAKPAPDTGAIQALVDRATAVREAADRLTPPAEGPRAASVILDPEANAAGTVRLLDSLRAGGFDAIRFEHASGSPAALLVRDGSPPDDVVVAGYERPTIVHVQAEVIDVWRPAKPAEGTEANAEREPPAGLLPGYRGKHLERLRVAIPTDEAPGIGPETRRAVLSAVELWQEVSGAGPVVHVAAADDALAANVVRIAQAFQQAEGADIPKPDAVWPGTSCSEDDEGAPCPTGVAVAFSKVAVPSSRGITATPKDKVVTPAKPPPASAEFCNERDIKTQMKKRAGSFRFCYERRLQLLKDLEGRLEMLFTIELDGSVSGLRAGGSSTLKDAKTVTCIKKHIGRMTFKKPDGGRCKVRWPFQFRSGG